MNYRKSFLIIIALFMAFSCGARANGLSWDTLWIQHYSGYVTKSEVIPGTDRAYGFYPIGRDTNNYWFFEFSDITGDTVRRICKVTDNVALQPVIRTLKDTNYIIGYDWKYRTRIYNIHTGQSTLLGRGIDGYNRSNNTILHEGANPENSEAMTIKIFNLDSNKVTTSISSILLDTMHTLLPYGHIGFSPKGTYVYGILKGLDMSQDMTPYKYLRTYLFNANDLSVKIKIASILYPNYVNWKDSIAFDYIAFDDNETKMALMNYSNSIIDIYDLSSNEKIKRIHTGFNDNLYSGNFQFDSTGNFLIVIMKSPIYQTIFYNIETESIDFMSDLLPDFGQRIVNTNYFISYNGYTTKFHLDDYTSDVNETADNKCLINLNSNNLSISSNEQTQISRFYIFDIKGSLVYKNEQSNYTPINEYINLNSGVYFITIVINGKNEYHKIIVQ